MKTSVKTAIETALFALQKAGKCPAELKFDIQVERARDSQHGDFASNIAMMLAKPLRRSPKDIAEDIVAHIPSSDKFKQWNIAGPGFINVFLADGASQAVVGQVLQQADHYGRSEKGRDQKVQIEFVSANPTGPLHVGHGRGAAYGAALANLLSFAGYQVDKEYYVNDAGRQMDILATSVWLRYLELTGETIDFPSNGYKGDYIFDLAATVHREHGDKFQFAAKDIFASVPTDAYVDADGNNQGDKELHIDALIEQAKNSLGSVSYRTIFDIALEAILGDIRCDLSAFGVDFDQWFSERSLFESDNQVDEALDTMRKAGHLYQKDGNWWFKSSEFGDEKDRVVVRENGSKTYLASDIAYHLNKLNRGYDKIIDIWGADHHGYVARVKAAIQALGQSQDKLDVLLVQFAILYRGKEKVAMSTRSGEFVTLRELREEIGVDAARFFYVMRKCEQHMDFDIELAKSKSNENPVYYIQYAHARICSVLRQLREKKIDYDQTVALKNLGILKESHEQQLMTQLSKFPEIIDMAAENYEAHHVAHYLRELANDFHTYYNAHQFIVEDENLRNARLALILAAKQVFVNGLGILGVSARESM